MNDTCLCRACGKTMPADAPHCPHCLSAIHDADLYGDECGGTLTPIGVWVRDDHAWEVLGRCSVCGEISATPAQAGDDPLILMSLAIRPLANPPFPLEKIEEMTTAMGGNGSKGGEGK